VVAVLHELPCAPLVLLDAGTPRCCGEGVIVCHYLANVDLDILSEVNAESRVAKGDNHCRGDRILSDHGEIVVWIWDQTTTGAE
jgi:hypothetical protein